MKDVFLTNYSDIKFLDKLKESISKCNSFEFSVSFIKSAGLVLIEKEIEEALSRGVSGKIITSTYQNFTDIGSLRTFYEWMKKYPNFSCHLDFNCFGDNGYHSKGYLFEYDNEFEFIIGSSNITRFALLKNIEWNVSLISKEKFNSLNKAIEEFDDLWTRTLPLSEDVIEKYRHALDFAIERWDMDYFNPDGTDIKPNAMQRRALKELARNRNMGVKRSLVIAATGSGKTYLSAFDAKNYWPKRLLFIVHRDQILIEAKKTFQKVFGAERSYGFFTGKEQNLDCDFLFATNSMISRHLDLFDKKEFDYIVLDECHHASAETYKKIMKYFEPGFMLGLTATPERMDNQDIFALFENNVPFELRLRDAIINDLVVPFHYYAIRDEFLDYSTEDKAKIAKNISENINVEFISSQIEKYKKANEKLKCIAFCTSIDHAKLMAEKFRSIGYGAISLVGTNNTGERIKAFEDLKNESNPLEIICTVDILNEGIDIPALNMVLFLRPTESSTIFLQQLGRGLRKYENKEYLTVLDFIGNNYQRSVQIALALGTLGKTVYAEKAYLKDLIRTDFESLNIEGLKIFFDELSKVEVINHLDNVNFNRKDFLQKDYENFKSYLGKETYPTHMDYLDSDIAPDLMRFMKSKISSGKNRSYYTFLSKINEEGLPLFNKEEVEFIDTLSDMLPLVRIDEYLIVKGMLNDNLTDYKTLIGYNSKVTKETLDNAYYLLKKNNIIVNDKLNLKSIRDELNIYLNDLLNYGITREENEFGEYEGKFKLYRNYYKEQIQMVRLREATMSVKGTEFDTTANVTYCYVNLHKDEKIKGGLKFKDKFLSSGNFQWESEKNTTKKNATGKKILNTKVVHLFIRKVKEEDGVTLPFTYFGTGRFNNIRDSFVEEKGKRIPTLIMDIELDNKVPSDYYLDFNIPEEE